MKFEKKSCSGFTLIEVLVGSAVFLVVALSAYGAYTSLFQVAQANQSKSLAIQLASEQMEIVHGMTYSNIGVVGGIPNGILPATQNITRGGIVFTVNLDIRATNTLPPLTGGGKLIEVNVSCSACKNFTPVVLTGQVMATAF